jgi:hypothetical protein
MAHADGKGKHTSVTDEKYRAMMDLKNKRKSKEERAQRRVSYLLFVSS